MHFRDLLRKDRSSTVCVHKNYLVDEKQTFMLLKKKRDHQSTSRTLQKQPLRPKQANHQVGQKLSPQVNVCFNLIKDILHELLSFLFGAILKGQNAW